jgi:plasmid stability protein
MAQVLVRDLDGDVVDRLKERARARGRSLEAELRLILQEAAGPSERQPLSLEEIRQMLAGRTFSDSTELLREDRDR